MPGILGSVGLTNLSAYPDAIPMLLAGLSSEPDYACQPVLATESSGAAILAAAWSPFAVYGSGEAPAAAVYGEVFENGTPAAESLAQRLATSPAESAEALLAGFDGSWCAFVWWGEHRGGALVVDHSASKPVYYAVQDGRLWFASEPKAIRGVRGVRTTLDTAAFAAYLTVGHVLNDQTLYAEVRSLEPGTILRFDREGARKQRYSEYRLADVGAPDEGETVYIERLHSALQSAISQRSGRLHEAVIPISGGWDSRAILAYAAPLMNTPLKTVSWGTNEDDPQGDAAIGRQLSRHFRTQHLFMRRDPGRLPATIEEMVERVDALTTDPALHYQEVEFMRRIRDELGVRYLLRGDEVFGYMAPVSSEAEALARIGIRKMDDYPDLLAALNPDVRQPLSSELAAIINRMSASCPLNDSTARKDFHYFYQRMFNYLHKSTYYKQTVLDIANPWLDRNVLQVNSGVPVPYRIDKQLFKRTVSLNFPDLRVPFAARPSLESWPAVFSSNARVRSFVQDHLSDRNNPIFGFLSQDHLLAVVNALAAGRQRQAARVRLAEALKGLVRGLSPVVYDKIRRRAVGRVKAATFSPVDLVFRALTLKLWFDRFRPIR